MCDAFIAYLQNGDTEQALSVFQKADQLEQLKMLSGIADVLQKNILQNVQTISILQRTLKPGKTYEDFAKAWMPPMVPYYPFPVTVINAQQFNKPQEVLSIGLIEADIDTVITTWQQGFIESDKARSENVQKIADSKGHAAMYTVAGVFAIGTES